MAVPHSTAPQEISHPLKCAERGCAFPPAPGETFCSYHAETFSAESSYVESALSGAISYRNAIGDGAGFHTESEFQHVIKIWKQWDAEGRCVGCGGPRDKLTKNCSLCLTEKKRISDALRAEGRCTSCARELDRVGWFCSVCLSRVLFLCRNRRAGRRAAGLCVRCGRNPALRGIGQCSTCTAQVAEADKRRYELRMRNGQCVDCGAKKITPHTRCSACKREVHKVSLALFRRRRAARICISCRAPLIDAHVLCRSCAKRHIKSDSSRYRRLKRSGICPRCKCISDRPHLLCSKCAKRNAEASIRRYRNRAQLGLCPGCGGSRSRDRKFRLCAKCRHTERAKSAKYYALRRGKHHKNRRVPAA